MKKQENSILRRLYADEVITAGGRIMEVHELIQDADFATMFGSLSNNLEKLWMPVAQRKAFCANHFDKLHKDGHSIFFLHKKDETKPATPDNLLVAHVNVRYDGLCVSEYCFEDDGVWDAKFQPRLASPMN